MKRSILFSFYNVFTRMKGMSAGNDLSAEPLGLVFVGNLSSSVLEGIANTEFQPPSRLPRNHEVASLSLEENEWSFFRKCS